MFTTGSYDCFNVNKFVIVWKFVGLFLSSLSQLALQSSLPIKFIKTPTIYDSEKSYINPIYEIFNFIKTIIHYKINNDI